MDYKNELINNGYFILENVFTEEEIQTFKTEILTYIRSHNTIRNSHGITIPDFITHNGLEKTATMKDKSEIHDALKEVFDDNYRFCSHNDIGINRIVGLHKDKLNGEYSKYETIDIWDIHNGEKHEIVKVLIYLQDHSDNNDGLQVIPGSHLLRNITRTGLVQLKPKIGDVIIFDQRITHRGMERQVMEPRILVAFGFGKNNIFTDNFEKGTVLRQNKQNNISV